ncbi:MAG TPA: carboxypeptidase-like regulatory domain-containing protein [Candidatus Sulfotelmatobacter sp.]
MRVRRQIFSSLFVCFLLCSACLWLVSPSAAWAQSTSTGTVVGTVTDPSGALVAGATITLTDASTKTARTDTTNDAGRYIFVDVAPGTYEISITKQGFSTTRTQTTVQVGQATTANMTLQVGTGNVVIEVTAVGNELQTMNATVGNTVTAIAIDNLPSTGRDVNTFIELQPGVSTGGDVGGAVNDQSYFSLDGGNNTNDMDGSGGVYTSRQTMLVIGDPTGGVNTELTYAAPSGVVPTPADSVEEFKVNTAGQTADFNSSAGAEIKVVTKRGTSAFHGTAYEYYKDNNWSSNTWQNNWLNYIPGDHVGLPSYHYSRFGGAIGGPLIPKDVLGGKTFFFFNYEGFRYPNSETIDRNVPSPALQLGLLTDSKTGAVDYNLNNAPVIYNGTSYAANYGCTGLCDPLGMGLNPLVSQIWSKYEPGANAGCSQSLCDGANILGFSANLSLPTSSKFAVVRIDHDFSSKQHLMASYRYYNIQLASDDEVDIGGFFPGDKLGTPASGSSDPVQDWYLVAGLTSNLTNNTTNDFHYSWLRNWWSWSRNGAPPQIPGLGGALEIMAGQSETQDLSPFNSDNQNIRARFWDGHDQMFRDDLSMLKGNHLFQLGGTYQHNWDYHQRNDSGGTINAYPVYSLGDGAHGSLLNDSGFQPCGATNSFGTATSINNCSALAAGALGVVSIASQLFTRTGASLALNPPLSNAFDKSTIPYYNVYFSDTWHMKPSLTFTYGLGWALEMPPVEQNGKQAMVVDASDEPINTADYLEARRRAALAGQVYNPELGFALVGNTGDGRKYPYNPFYGEFSPRVALAWNPHFDSDSLGGKLFGHENTVIRGGYGRSYGRTNGVAQVLVPLLGLGLEQPIACNSNIVAAGGWSCAASGAGTWSSGFRVGQNASSSGGPTVPLSSLATATLPQPVYPGVNNPASSGPEALDPNFRPNQIDSFNFTIQRQLNRRMTMELGYIGRRITKEFEPVQLNAVPYMMTMGGQTFANAYKNVVLQYCGGVTGLGGGGCGGSALPTPGTGPSAGAVTPQPFFEAALANTGYCTGYTSCTAAFVANEGVNGTANLTNAQVWSIWSDLDNGGFNFPRSMMNTPIPGTAPCPGSTTLAPCGAGGQYTSGIFENASVGYGNYNGAFVSLKMAEWHGLTAQSNFTWSKALGTGAQAQSSSELAPLDPFNFSEMYGRQAFDRKFIYNMFLVYQPPFFKGQSGLMGRVLGGWTFASIFTAGSGLPIQAVTTYGDYQSFGSCDGVTCADYDSENAVPIGPVAPHSHAYACHAASAGSDGNYYAACPGQAPGSSYPINEFKDGALEYANWRNPILGLDTRDGGYGIVNGLPYWNMDFSIKKNIRVAESVSLELQGVFANVLNHDQMFDGFPGLYSPTTWGAIGGEASPRNIELGARVRF